MLIKSLNHYILLIIKKIRKDIVVIITIIGGILGILVSLGKLGILIPIWDWLIKVGSFIVFQVLLADFFGAPLLVWLILIIYLIMYFRQRQKIDIVAGDFKDDFENGLSKWEFGNEGWKIEYDDKHPVLSVSQSREGGITKKGFSWSDYEFSFDTKPIRKNLGWIIRAENRSKFLMVQLNMGDPNKTLLRLHLKVPGTTYPWVVIQEDLIEKVEFMEWIRVKTVVLGSNVDIYFNNKHVGHYLIPDPIAIPTEELVQLQEVDKKVVKKVLIKRDYVTMNYSIGKVGFRCDPLEHAHFRNVRVKPIL